MKIYHIYFSDYPEEFTKAICKNVSDAKKKAKEYLKIWNLDAEILKIEYIGEFGE
jgi:hypothetical protein